MNILLLGSSGFIGSRVACLLMSLGHSVVTANRQEVDFSNPNSLTNNRLLIHCLQRADTVINTIGIMHNNIVLMDNIHYQSVLQVAQMAKKFSVKRWINLSALGADSRHAVAFLSTKGRGDECLLQLADDNFSVLIARPSLVFGQSQQASNHTQEVKVQTLKSGASSDMFIKLAKLSTYSLPLPLPNAGQFNIQPVHVDDVAEGLVILSTSEDITHATVINMTGIESCTLAEYIQTLSNNIYGKPLKILPVPIMVAKYAIKTLSHFNDMLNIDSLTMLEEGSVADYQQFATILKRNPLSFREFKP